MIQGAIHVHSTYSDGEFRLAELREVYAALGCRFVLMTDHAEDFDAARLADYVAECESLSDERFRFIAGLEFNCDRRMHVLGFGVTRLVATTDPQAVIRHIKSEGGVAVIAHPMDSAFEWIESFDELPHGIETWNSKYDGRYAPRPQTFALLGRLQRRAPRMRAFYGQDLHWRRQHRGLLNYLQTASADREAVLSAFERGDYFAVKGDAELPSSGVLSAELLARFGDTNRRYARRRQLIKQAKRLIDRAGLRLPAPLKAQLRRIF
ncbi:MAG TPA: PHP domain-containing protein [Blastocatellia bacterium]|nr:PHP domain-containing protein [Blastocatellia bacterium]